MSIITGILILTVFFVPPAGAAVWFFTALSLFRRTPQNDPLYRGRKIRLIVSAVLTGVLVFLLIAAITMYLRVLMRLL